MIDLGALEFFHRVGKLGGVGAAARSLGVTQPAVSQRVRRLERSLGKTLLGKVDRRITLTADGKRVYEACRRIFDITNTIEASFNGALPTLLGTIRVGGYSETCKVFLLPLLREFHRLHPSIEVDVRYQWPEEMVASLCRNEVDIIIASEPYGKPQIEMVPLFEVRMICVGPAPGRKLSWKDLGTLPWLSYGTDDLLLRELERMAAKKKVALARPALRVPDSESILRLAATGAGCALTAEFAFQFRRLKGLAEYGLPAPLPTVKIYCGRLKALPMDDAARAFWNFIIPRLKSRRA